MKPSSLLVVLALVVATLSPAVRAEEGGSGHYVPGSIASFADTVPQEPTFIARLNFVSYAGSFSGNPLPFARFAATDVDAESIATGLTLVWRPKFELGEKLSYAMSATIPYVWLDVSGGVEAKTDVVKGMPLGRTVAASRRVSDSADGIGDVVLMPLMLNYQFAPDFGMNFRVAAYAPTGGYSTGSLANTGKNFWTIEPTLGAMYFGQKNGREATVFAGIDFNSENDDTEYKSGNQFHLDGTLAQHFPLAGGLAGIGVNGFWYEQLTGDSGRGATFGAFKARTAGLGPVVSYTHKLGDTDLIIEAKWLHEIETRNRLEGDYLWLKVLLKF